MAANEKRQEILNKALGGLDSSHRKFTGAWEVFFQLFPVT